MGNHRRFRVVGCMCAPGLGSEITPCLTPEDLFFKRLLSLTASYPYVLRG